MPLPNTHALGWLEPHLVFFGHIKGLIEGVKVADNLIAAELIGAMWIGCDTATSLLWTILSAP